MQHDRRRADSRWRSRTGNRDQCSRILRSTAPLKLLDIIRTVPLDGDLIRHSESFFVADKHYTNEFAVFVGDTSKARKGRANYRRHPECPSFPTQ